MRELVKKLTAKLGYQTHKKQILIISDDWGSVRLKSLAIREELRAKGIDVDANRFDQFDCLESNKDLEDLFEVLSKYKDRLGNHPCITAVTNVANPDFQAIQKDNYQVYHFETIEKTYQRYPISNRVLALTKEGIANKIFIPQSHGREHVHVNWWMQELQDENSMARKVFGDEFFFLGKAHVSKDGINGLGSSLEAKNVKDFNTVKEITQSSLEIFKELYGFEADLFCPPTMRYTDEILSVLQEKNIKWLDVARVQKVTRKNKPPRRHFHVLGQKSDYGFKYMVRNTVFETNFSHDNNGVLSCLKGIQEAFDCKQPAIISNHRASFVGGVEEQNRTKGLKALDILLREILQKWPDVEFISLDNL